MNFRGAPALLGAAAIAAAACRGSSKTDTVSGDSAVAQQVADTAALASSTSANTAGSPTSANVPNAQPTAPTTKRATATATHSSGVAAAAKTKTTATPQPSSPSVQSPVAPAPGVTPPAGATTPAYIVFRDAILPSDLEWLRAQGFTIVAVTEATHGVRLAVPDGYSGNPKANPRVARFSITMR